MYKKVLVAMALDHEVSRNTLAFANAICEDGGTILALHVMEEPSGTASARLREDLLAEGSARAASLFKDKLVDYPNVEPIMAHGHPSRVILETAAERGVDCIVMGSHKPGLADYFIGSTAARVVRHAECSVHVYRG
ncbi:MAG: universal stress protein [Pseudomonadota bacterium]